MEKNFVSFFGFNSELLNADLQPVNFCIKITIMIKIFFIPLVFICAGLGAAPLESGFSLAPSVSATPAEKAAAYQNARNRLLAAAGQYERTPYRYAGIDKNGMDCSGLVYASFRDALGINVPRDSSGQYAWAEKISIENAHAGDLVFFITTGGSKISHVGIYAGNGRFIHSASEGPVTGVMYSSLSESYWSRTFAGAGRALPPGNTSGSGTTTVTPVPSTPDKKEPATAKKPQSKTAKSKGGMLMNVAAAPTWGGGKYDGENIIRGAAGHFGVGAEVKPFGQSMIIGAELRPEWDRTLGVYRLPLTLSMGLDDDKWRIFAGPALSLGDASLTVSGEDRSYSGEVNWFGAGGVNWLGAAVGITYAPFTLEIAGTEWSLYGELAWQSYFSDNAEPNFGADLAASLRFSTGLRCSWRLK
jgi:probable lipoprotein NlpC